MKKRAENVVLSRKSERMKENIKQVAAFASSRRRTGDNTEALEIPNVLQFIDYLTAPSLFCCAAVHVTCVLKEKRSVKAVPSTLCRALLPLVLTGQPFSPLAFTAAGAVKSIDSFPQYMKTSIQLSVKRQALTDCLEQVNRGSNCGTGNIFRLNSASIEASEPWPHYSIVRVANAACSFE